MHAQGASLSIERTLCHRQQQGRTLRASREVKKSEDRPCVPSLVHGLGKLDSWTRSEQQRFSGRQADATHRPHTPREQAEGLEAPTCRRVATVHHTCHILENC